MFDTGKILKFVKENILLTVLIGIVFISLFFSRQVAKLFRAKPKRRRRRTTTARNKPTRRRTTSTRTRKAASKGVRSSSKGYAAAAGGYIPFKYNKDGTVKKAWQVAGTVAAKQRMSRLRKRR